MFGESNPPSHRAHKKNGEMIYRLDIIKSEEHITKKQRITSMINKNFKNNTYSE